MMSPEKRAMLAARIEQAKDDTPTTSAFVWFVPAFCILAWLTRQTAPEPEAVVCIVGWCL